MRSTWSISSLTLAALLSLALGVVAGRLLNSFTALSESSDNTAMQLDLVVGDKILTAIENNDLEKAGRLLRNHIRINSVAMRVIRGDGSPELEALLKRREALISSRESASTSDRLAKCGAGEGTNNQGKSSLQTKPTKGCTT